MSREVVVSFPSCLTYFHISELTIVNCIEDSKLMIEKLNWIVQKIALKHNIEAKSEIALQKL